MLRCFYLASGLTVNLSNSKVFGVGVEFIDIDRFPNILNYEAIIFPFSYHGLPIGANMKLTRNCLPIIKKFKNKLSIWKAKNLSFGGKLTLVNYVLSNLPLYNFALFKALKKVIELLDGVRRRLLYGEFDNRQIH